MLGAGPSARITTMIVAGLVAIMLIGAVVEQRQRAGRGLDPPPLGASALAILQAASALGVLSMVVIQSCKQPLRGKFHARALRQWLGDDPQTFDEVIELIAPAYERDILALPVEQLAAQLASLADIALLGDKERLLGGLAGEKGRPLAGRYEELFTMKSKSSDADFDRMPELLEARSNLSHIIQRRIDGFQVHFGNEWRSILRFMAIALSGLLAALGIFVSGELVSRPYTAAAFALIVGLLGGLLASVARDVVAIVEKYRR